MSRIRVLLADDHTVVRRGFALMLQAEPDIVVVGEAADGAAAVRQARALSPDVVLMDVQMPGTDGIEATERVTGAGLAQVIVLTAFDDDEALFSALSAGAAGYLLKNADPAEIADAVRQVYQGHGHLAPEVTRRVLARLPRRPRAAEPSASSQALGSLTSRERDVLRLVAQGRTNHEIAEELALGVTTVKSYLSACLAKLHARDRVQLVVLAYETGLVRPGDGGYAS